MEPEEFKSRYKVREECNLCTGVQEAFDRVGRPDGALFYYEGCGQKEEYTLCLPMYHLLLRMSKEGSLVDMED